MGGLKGKMAPGDAHPYLALFYLILLTFLAQTVDFESVRGRDDIRYAANLGDVQIRGLRERAAVD